jgi:hypothetical protein
MPTGHDFDLGHGRHGRLERDTFGNVRALYLIHAVANGLCWGRVQFSAPALGTERRNAVYLERETPLSVVGLVRCDCGTVAEIRDGAFLPIAPVQTKGGC